MNRIVEEWLASLSPEERDERAAYLRWTGAKADKARAAADQDRRIEELHTEWMEAVDRMTAASPLDVSPFSTPEDALTEARELAEARRVLLPVLNRPQENT
jgi:hypothetical protein